MVGVQNFLFMVPCLEEEKIKTLKKIEIMGVQSKNLASFSFVLWQALLWLENVLGWALRPMGLLCMSWKSFELKLLTLFTCIFQIVISPATRSVHSLCGCPARVPPMAPLWMTPPRTWRGLVVSKRSPRAVPVARHHQMPQMYVHCIY